MSFETSGSNHIEYNYIDRAKKWYIFQRLISNSFRFYFFQPLYLPNKMLHLVHQCSVTFNDGTQKGTRQHGQHLKEK